MKAMIKAALFVALVVLALPTAAFAKQAELDGPGVYKGSGFFGGELTMESTDEQRPLRITGRGGYVGFLDLEGDLKVRCQGKGKMRKRETKQGTVVLCMGRGGRATAVGSHFKLRGFAKRYRIAVPEGVTGKLHGRFVSCSEDDCSEVESDDEPSDDSTTTAAERRADRKDAAAERVEARKDKRAELKEKRDARKEKRDARKEKRGERKDQRDGKTQASPAQQ